MAAPEPKPTPEYTRVAAMSGPELIAEAMRLAEISGFCGTPHTAAVLKRLAELLDTKG